MNPVMDEQYRIELVMPYKVFCNVRIRVELVDLSGDVDIYEIVRATKDAIEQVDDDAITKSACTLMMENGEWALKMDRLRTGERAVFLIDGRILKYARWPEGFPERIKNELLIQCVEKAL